VVLRENGLVFREELFDLKLGMLGRRRVDERILPIYGLVCPCSGGSGICVSCMSALNQLLSYRMLINDRSLRSSSREQLG